VGRGGERRIAGDMQADFFDFDHENERRVTLAVDGLNLLVSRELGFNADYAPDAEEPEPWEEDRKLRFETAGALAAFLLALGEALMDACFAYYADDEEVDGYDESRAAWAEFVGQLPAKPEGDVDAAVIQSIVSFPR
jgi:hypothetical protein